MSKSLKHLFLSLSSGVALGLSWPTNGLTILIFVALIPLLFLENSIRKETNKRNGLGVFGYSYLTFLIWNLITTWWLYNSTVFGMLFANLCNSLFYALVFQLFSWSKKRLPLKTSYIFLVSSWLAFEKLHLFWDFSWTWLNLGNVFSEHIYWIQWYEYTGTFGGTLWVLIVNLWVFSILKDPLCNTAILRVRKLVGPLLFMALPIVFSLYLYQQVEDPEKTIDVVLVQPNIDPYDEKYNLTNQKLFSLLIDQIEPQITPETSYVITPETYFAEGFGEELNSFKTTSLHKSIQKNFSNNDNIQLITGIQFYNTFVQEDPPSLTANYIRPNLWVEFYNSALSEQFDQQPQEYHKSKLVVGVENMPFKSILNPLIGDLMIDLGGTVSSRVIQKERTVFKHAKNNEKAAPIICFESIFGEFVTGYIKNGATFLAVISNDAWWGQTPGHRQLLSYTRLRAIETRRDIARSANTGISAFINAKGEILQQTEYNTKTLLKGQLASRSELTFYVRFGDLIARWSIFISVLFLLLALSGRLKPLNN